MSALSDALQGILPGSDPNTPNAFVQSPQAVQQQQALADALSREGSSYTPVASPWQGAARLAQALAGAIGSAKAGQAQRLGTSNAAAEFGNAVGSDPGSQNIAATPGQTTLALQTSDQRNDAISDAEDGGASPQAALAAALAGGSPPAPALGKPALVAALGGVNTQARGMRNNNPGNLEANSWTESLPGYTGTDGRFAIFNSPQAGQAALDRNLQSYGAKGIATPLAIASTWAPGSEQGNNPNSYGAVIAKTLGVGLNDPVNMSDPATRAKIGQAIALVENGPAKGGSPALAAINAATGNQGRVSTSLAYAPDQPSPVVAGATPPGGPQGAGVSPSPAPSQAPAAGPLSGPGVAPQTMSAPAPSPAPGMPPQGGAFHPDVQSLLNVLSDPWASAAQQQIAQQMISAQMPTPPTFGVIAKDPITGNEQYGWINPKTQTVTPAGGASGASGSAGGPALPASAPPPATPAPAPGSAPPPPAPAPAPAPGAAQPGPQTLSGSVDMASANGLTPQGAAYLNSVEQQGSAGSVVARQARAIINGQAPLPEANAATKPIDIAVRDAVFKAAPTFNSSVAATRVKMAEDYADKTSPTSAGGMILSANAALHHLNALADSADQVHQTGIIPDGSPIVNAVTNFTREHTMGFPALKAYDFNKNALADEVAKIYKGGTPAEGEIQAMLSSLSPNMTPAEHAAVFSKVSTLLQGKTTELQRQWQTAFGPNSSYPVIGQEGQQVINRFANGGGAPQANAPAVPNLNVGDTHSVGGVTIKRIN